jgi:hypothetical protein
MIAKQIAEIIYPSSVIFTKSLLYVMNHLIESKRVIKLNSTRKRNEVFYSLYGKSDIFNDNALDLPKLKKYEDLPIVCMSLKNSILMRFLTAKQASDVLGITIKDILKVCKGVKRTTSKLKFRFGSNKTADKCLRNNGQESVEEVTDFSFF